MESEADANTDQVVPGVNYSPPGGTASYVTARTSVTLYPQGSNFYSISGTRMVRFVVSDTNLLDLSTCRLAFKLTNKSATLPLSLNPPCPNAIWSRVRVLLGGTLVEDILLAGRTQGLLERLKSTNRRWSESLEFWADGTAPNAGVTAAGANQYPDSSVLRGPVGFSIPAGQTRTCITPILSGLMNSWWWLPCRHAPLTLELIMADSADQCCMRGANPPAAATASQDFSLEDVRLLGDMIEVDSSLHESMSKILLEGGSLPLHFSSWSNTVHALTLGSSLTNNAWSVQLSRAFKNIKSIFISFDSDGSRGIYGTYNSNHLFWNGRNGWDDYYGTTNDYQPALCQDWRFQFQLGSILVPQQPMSSTQEAWMHLAKLLGHLSSLESVSIPPGEWISRSFCIGLDCEKANATPGSGMASMTGLATLDPGATMRFAFENVNCRNQASIPQRMFIHIHHEVAVSIRAEGVIVAY